MDKYEFRLRADEIKKLISEKQYREAVEIADTIDWRNVKNSSIIKYMCYNIEKYF